MFVDGMKTLRKLCDALGLDPDKHPIQKIVIECDCSGDVMKVFITRLIHEHELDKVIELIREPAAVCIGDR